MLGLASIPFLVRWLGEPRFGALQAAAEWLRQGAVLEIGAALALAPVLDAALGHNDRHALRRAMHAAIRTWGVRALIVLVFGAAVTASITFLVPTHGLLARDLTNGCLVALIGSFLIPLGPFEVLLQAQQRRITVSVLGLVQAAVTTGLALLFARRGFDLPGQFLALLAGHACFRLGIALAARDSLLGFGAVLSEPPDPDTTARLGRLDFQALVVRFAGQVGRHTDAILVALLLGPRRVVPLFLTRHLAAAAAERLRLNASATSATATGWQGEAAVGVASQVPALTRSLGGLAVAALVPVFAWNGAFVTLWVGGDQFVGDRFTALACANAYMLALAGLWTSVFEAGGRTRLLFPAAAAAAALNLGIAVWATRTMGVIGPLVGTAAASAAVSMWAVPALLARHWGASFFRVAFAAVTPLLWGLPAAWGLWTWAQLNPPESWPALLLEVGAAAAALLAVWWLAALTPAARTVWRARVTAGIAGL